MAETVNFTHNDTVLHVESIINTILATYSMRTLTECKNALTMLSKVLRGSYNLVVYWNAMNYDEKMQSIPILIKNIPKVHNINAAASTTTSKPYKLVQLLRNDTPVVVQHNTLLSQSSTPIDDSASDGAQSIPETHTPEEIPLTTYGVYSLSGAPVVAKMLFRNFSKPVSCTMSRQGIINLMDSGYKMYELLDGTRLIAYYDFMAEAWKYASNNSADISNTSWRGYTFADLIADTNLDTSVFDKYCVYNLVVYNPKVHCYGGYNPTATVINVFDADGNPMYPELWQKPIEMDSDQAEYVNTSLKLSHEEYKRFIRGEITALGNFMGYMFRHDNISYTCYALYSKLYTEIRKMLYNNKKVNIELFGNDKYLVCTLYVRYGDTDIVQKLIPSIGERVTALRNRLSAVANHILYKGADHVLIQAKKLLDVGKMYETIKTVLTDNELIFYGIVQPLVLKQTRVSTIYKPTELQAKHKLILSLLTSHELYEHYRNYIQF